MGSWSKEAQYAAIAKLQDASTVLVIRVLGFTKRPLKP